MLIECPECHGKVSSAAKICPHCGCPVKLRSVVICRCILYITSAIVLVGVLAIRSCIAVNGSKDDDEALIAADPNKLLGEEPQMQKSPDPVVWDNLQFLCHEWSGRRLCEEAKKEDVRYGDLSDGRICYHIKIGNEFKGHGGMPYLFTRDGKSCLIACSTLDTKPMPTQDEFRLNEVVKELSSRLDIMPDFRCSKRGIRVEMRAEFRVGDKLAATVSLVNAEPSEWRQKEVTFYDFRLP